MVHGRTLAPEHFINPSLHAYTTYVAVRAAYALAPRQAPRYQVGANAELTNPSHPDRPIQFLAFRLARLFSVAFQLATVLLIFRVARQTVDETTGFVAAWFAAATMGFVNMAHFATGESLLFLLCTWALWRFSSVADRGWWRDYALAGLATGLACSTKYTPCVLAAPFLVAHFIGRGAARGCRAPASHKWRSPWCAPSADSLPGPPTRCWRGRCSAKGSSSRGSPARPADRSRASSTPGFRTSALSQMHSDGRCSRLRWPVSCSAAGGSRAADTRPGSCISTRST